MGAFIEHAPCCGACGHAAEVARKGGARPNHNPHLRFDLVGGVPRGVVLVLWTVRSGTRSKETIIPIDKPYVVVGRVEPADIVVESDVLSRKHCGLDFRSGEAVLEDLDSSCGTYLNGEQIQRVALRAGDEISMGNHVMQIRLTHGSVGR